MNDLLKGSFLLRPLEIVKENLDELKQANHLENKNDGEAPFCLQDDVQSFFALTASDTKLFSSLWDDQQPQFSMAGFALLGSLAVELIDQNHSEAGSLLTFQFTDRFRLVVEMQGESVLSASIFDNRTLYFDPLEGGLRKEGKNFLLELNGPKNLIFTLRLEKQDGNWKIFPEQKSIDFATSGLKAFSERAWYLSDDHLLFPLSGGHLKVPLEEGDLELTLFKLEFPEEYLGQNMVLGMEKDGKSTSIRLGAVEQGWILSDTDQSPKPILRFDLLEKTISDEAVLDAALASVSTPGKWHDKVSHKVREISDFAKTIFQTKEVYGDQSREFQNALRTYQKKMLNFADWLENSRAERFGETLSPYGPANYPIGRTFVTAWTHITTAMDKDASHNPELFIPLFEAFIEGRAITAEDFPEGRARLEGLRKELVSIARKEKNEPAPTIYPIELRMALLDEWIHGSNPNLSFDERLHLRTLAYQADNKAAIYQSYDIDGSDASFDRTYEYIQSLTAFYEAFSQLYYQKHGFDFQVIGLGPMRRENFRSYISIHEKLAQVSGSENCEYLDFYFALLAKNPLPEGPVREKIVAAQASLDRRDFQYERLVQILDHILEGPPQSSVGVAPQMPQLGHKVRTEDLAGIATDSKDGQIQVEAHRESLREAALWSLSQRYTKARMHVTVAELEHQAEVLVDLCADLLTDKPNFYRQLNTSSAEAGLLHLLENVSNPKAMEARSSERTFLDRLARIVPVKKYAKARISSSVSERLELIERLKTGEKPVDFSFDYASYFANPENLNEPRELIERIQKSQKMLEEAGISLKENPKDYARDLARYQEGDPLYYAIQFTMHEKGASRANVLQTLVNYRNQRLHAGQKAIYGLALYDTLNTLSYFSNVTGPIKGGMYQIYLSFAYGEAIPKGTPLYRILAQAEKALRPDRKIDEDPKFKEFRTANHLKSSTAMLRSVILELMNGREIREPYLATVDGSTYFQNLPEDPLERMRYYLSATEMADTIGGIEVFAIREGAAPIFVPYLEAFEESKNFILRYASEFLELAPEIYKKYKAAGMPDPLSTGDFRALVHLIYSKVNLEKGGRNMSNEANVLMTLVEGQVLSEDHFARPYFQAVYDDLSVAEPKALFLAGFLGIDRSDEKMTSSEASGDYDAITKLTSEANEANEEIIFGPRLEELARVMPYDSPRDFFHFEEGKVPTLREAMDLIKKSEDPLQDLRQLDRLTHLNAVVRTILRNNHASGDEIAAAELRQDRHLFYRETFAIASAYLAWGLEPSDAINYGLHPGIVSVLSYDLEKFGEMGDFYSGQLRQHYVNQVIREHLALGKFINAAEYPELYAGLNRFLENTKGIVLQNKRSEYYRSIRFYEGMSSRSVNFDIRQRYQLAQFLLGRKVDQFKTQYRKRKTSKVFADLPALSEEQRLKNLYHGELPEILPSWEQTQEGMGHLRRALYLEDLFHEVIDHRLARFGAEYSAEEKLIYSETIWRFVLSMPNAARILQAIAVAEPGKALSPSYYPAVYLSFHELVARIKREGAFRKSHAALDSVQVGRIFEDILEGQAPGDYRELVKLENFENAISGANSVNVLDHLADAILVRAMREGRSLPYSHLQVSLIENMTSDIFNDENDLVDDYLKQHPEAKEHYLRYFILGEIYPGPETQSPHLDFLFAQVEEAWAEGRTFHSDHALELYTQIEERRASFHLLRAGVWAGEELEAVLARVSQTQVAELVKSNVVELEAGTEPAQTTESGLRVHPLLVDSSPNERDIFLEVLQRGDVLALFSELNDLAEAWSKQSDAEALSQARRHTGVSVYLSEAAFLKSLHLDYEAGQALGINRATLNALSFDLYPSDRMTRGVNFFNNIFDLSLNIRSLLPEDELYQKLDLFLQKNERYTVYGNRTRKRFSKTVYDYRIESDSTVEEKVDIRDRVNLARFLLSRSLYLYKGETREEIPFPGLSVEERTANLGRAVLATELRTLADLPRQEQIPAQTHESGPSLSYTDRVRSGQDLSLKETMELLKADTDSAKTLSELKSELIPAISRTNPLARLAQERLHHFFVQWVLVMALDTQGLDLDRASDYAYEVSTIKGLFAQIAEQEKRQSLDLSDAQVMNFYEAIARGETITEVNDPIFYAFLLEIKKTAANKIARKGIHSKDKNSQIKIYKSGAWLKRDVSNLMIHNLAAQLLGLELIDANKKIKKEYARFPAWSIQNDELSAEPSLPVDLPALESGAAEVKSELNLEPDLEEAEARDGLLPAAASLSPEPVVDELEGANEEAKRVGVGETLEDELLSLLDYEPAELSEYLEEHRSRLLGSALEVFNSSERRELSNPLERGVVLSLLEEVPEVNLDILYSLSQGEAVQVESDSGQRLLDVLERIEEREVYANRAQLIRGAKVLLDLNPEAVFEARYKINELPRHFTHMYSGMTDQEESALLGEINRRKESEDEAERAFWNEVFPEEIHSVSVESLFQRLRSKMDSAYAERFTARLYAGLSRYHEVRSYELGYAMLEATSHDLGDMTGLRVEAQARYFNHIRGLEERRKVLTDKEQDRKRRWEEYKEVRRTRAGK